MKSAVVYQAYGRADIVKQNLFSIISLLRYSEGLKAVDKILIYTDQSEYFKQFLGEHPLVQYHDMGPERLQKWRGQIQFVHRVKIEMLKDATKLFPKSNLFYMDGDTYFSKAPENLMAQIGPQKSIMHEAENVIEQGKDPLSKKVKKFLKQNEFQIKGKSLKIPTHQVMWNAGVLGFSPSFFSDLDSVLEFTDQAYSRYQKHVMEQLAFSYFLSEKGKIIDARAEVHHYWRQKDQFNVLIEKFLSETKSLTKALAEFDKIQWPEPPQPKVTFWQKLTKKFFN